jgi:hypothetical protein
VEVNGIRKDLVSFFKKFIYLGKREAIGDHVFAVGAWNGETIVTLSSRDTLPELPEKAFLMPRRFLMTAYPNLRQLTTKDLAEDETSWVRENELNKH